MALILEKSKENDDVESLKTEVRRVIRSSLGTRAKEELIMDFINSTRLSELKNTDDILESFYKFARKEKDTKIKKLIELVEPTPAKASTPKNLPTIIVSAILYNC